MKSNTLGLRMSEEMTAAVDLFCKRRQISRSDCTRIAICELLRTEEGELFDELRIEASFVQVKTRNRIARQRRKESLRIRRIKRRREKTWKERAELKKQEAINKLNVGL